MASVSCCCGRKASKSLFEVSATPKQKAISTSEPVTSRSTSLSTSSASSSSSVTTHVTSVNSASSSSSPPVASKLSSETASPPAPADVTYDDDDDDVFIDLKALMSPVDPSVHLHPPAGSYQRNMATSRQQSEISRSKKPAWLILRRLRSTNVANTRPPTSCVNFNRSSSERYRRRPTLDDKDKSALTRKLSMPAVSDGQAAEKHSALDDHNDDAEASCIHDEVTRSASDVVNNTDNGVNVKSCDSGNNQTAVLHSKTLPRVMASSPMDACPPHQRFNTVHVERPSKWQPHQTSPTETLGSQHDDSTTTTYTSRDNNNYARLVRPRDSASEWHGYTQLTAAARGSMITEATGSYESLQSRTTTLTSRCRPTADNDSIVTAGEYLHPGL